MSPSASRPTSDTTTTTSRSRVRGSAIRRWAAAVVSLVTMVAIGGVQATSALAAPGDFTNYTSGLGSNVVRGVYATDDTIYAATNGGLSISIDSGISFTNYTSGLGGNFVLGVYATDDTIYAATNGGLSISTDGGTTFTNYTSGLGNNFVRGVYAIGSTVYAATLGGLSISTNGGTTFTNKTTGHGLGTNVVNGVYVIGSTVYAATANGLSISTDGGTSFTNKRSGDGLGSNAVVGVYAIGSTVYAATDGGGLSISTNGGATFTNKTTTDGLGSNNVLGVYAIGSTVYAATTGGLSIGSSAAPPGLLADVTVAAGDGTASVSWTVDDTGGSTVTRIEFALDDTVTVDDSTTNFTGPHTLTGLVNGQTYTVYARAVNTVGAGPWSTGTPVTPQAPPPTPTPVFPPGAPGSVTAVPGVASATVSWTAPADPGSYPVSTYQVSATPGGRSCMTSTLTCEVSGLTNGTTYTFTVKALNGAGWSPASSPSNTVTPQAAPKPSILISGSRTGSTIQVDGTTIDLTGTVTPWVKLPGQTSFTEGSARPTITDNAFTWSRKANKRISVYITHGDVKSNTITIAAR